MTNNSALQARPHSFIASDIKHCLEQARLSVINAEKSKKFAGLSHNSLAAVISLVVNSSMEASPENIIKIFRKVRPAMPLLFAAFLPYTKALLPDINIEVSLERTGQQTGLSPKILELEDAVVQSAELGRPAVLLFLSTVDLSESVTRQEAVQTTRRHFDLDRR